MFLRISRDFADLLEIRGSATAQYIRSPGVMQKQGNGKSVVHNKPEYEPWLFKGWITLSTGRITIQWLAWFVLLTLSFYPLDSNLSILLILYTSPYHIHKTVLIAKNK